MSITILREMFKTLFGRGMLSRIPTPKPENTVMFSEKFTTVLPGYLNVIPTLGTAGAVWADEDFGSRNAIIITAKKNRAAF